MNVENFIIMSGMSCSSLLIDISKFSTNYVTDNNDMFGEYSLQIILLIWVIWFMNYECSSLSIDISKRNKIYIPDKIDIFLIFIWYIKKESKSCN